MIDFTCSVKHKQKTNIKHFCRNCIRIQFEFLNSISLKTKF